MESNDTVYKLGDWIEHVRSGDVYEITQIKQFESTVLIDIEFKLDARTGDTHGISRRLTKSDLRTNFKHARVAQVLYKTNVTRR